MHQDLQLGSFVPSIGLRGGGLAHHSRCRSGAHWIRPAARIAPVLVSLAAAAPALAFQGSTARASLDSFGVEADSSSLSGSISADGLLVVFESSATNLVPGDTNTSDDIFLRDLSNGTTARVSVATGGVEANGHSYAPAISGDGRFVVFHSSATNLVTGDTNAFDDVFLHDTQTGTTTRLSVSTGGTQGNGDSQFARISDNGNRIIFHSYASNLVGSDTNGTPAAFTGLDVFVRDRNANTTVRVSLTNGGAQSNGDSGNPAISADGRYVVFQSSATNLTAAPDSNGALDDIFVRDTVSSTTALCSRNNTSFQGNMASYLPVISADGRWVAFNSDADNLVTMDGNGLSDTFLFDRQTLTTSRVSVSSTGVEAFLGSRSFNRPAISSDGRYVAYFSAADNLVSGDFNVQDDVFVHDRVTARTSLVSLDGSGVQGTGYSIAPSISGDGRYVVFVSSSATLVAADTNGSDDIFVRDRGWLTATAFCFGDGNGTPCPCNNSGSPGHGCNNSAGTGGGSLGAIGVASVSADTVVLQATSLTASATTLFFQGDAQLNGGFGSTLGDGLSCAGGTLIRLGTRAASGGAVSFGFGIAGDPLVSVRGLVPAAGGTRYYQGWYRNSASFCTPSTFNLTNGAEIVWLP